MKKEVIYEILGWLGMLLLLGGYTGLSFEFFEEESLTYILMNLFGAGFIALNAWRQKDNPAAVLNIIWMGIAVVSLGRIIF